VLGSIQDDSDETVIPLYRIYNDLAAHLDIHMTAHKPLLSSIITDS
jgi:hypothetical protein